MNLGSLTISIRLFHPTITPEQISEAVATEPSAAKRRDSTLASGHQQNYWALKLLTRKDAELVQAFENANAWVRERQGFLANFRSSGGSIVYYVTISSEDRFAVELTESLFSDFRDLAVNVSLEILH